MKGSERGRLESTSPHRSTRAMIVFHGEDPAAELTVMKRYDLKTTRKALERESIDYRLKTNHHFKPTNSYLNFTMDNISTSPTISSSVCVMLITIANSNIKA